MKKLITLAGISCLLLMLAALPLMTACTPAAPEQTVLKMHIAFPTTHVIYPYHQWAVDEVWTRSNGTLAIQIYPAFSLGFKPPTWFRDVKDGLIEITSLTNLYTCGEAPYFCVVEADDLSKTREQMVRAVAALAPFKKRVYEEVWDAAFIATGCCPCVTSVIGTVGKQLKTIDDLKGMKIRAPGARATELIAALGAAPQSMSKTEVYMALKTGVVDGFMSGYGSLYAEKIYEVFDYATVIGTPTALQEDIVLSKKTWDTLSSKHQEILREVYEEWAARSWEYTLTGEVDAKDKAALEGAGIITNEFSAADKEKVRQTMLQLQDEWAQTQSDLVKEAWSIVKPIFYE